MTIHDGIRLNETEEQLIATAEALASADASDAVRTGRRTAINMLKSAGLPNRRQERWHYTDLKALLAGAGRATAGDGAGAIDDPAMHVSLDNGCYATPLAAPPGFALETAVHPAIAPNSAMDDTIKVLNTALLADQLNITVSANPAMPLRWTVRATGGAACHGRAAIAVDAGCAATIVIDRRLEAGSFSTFVLDLDCQANADLTIVLCTDDAVDAKALANIGGQLAEQAKVTVVTLNVGAGFNRTELEFKAVGDGAHIGLYGANCLAGKQIADTTLIVDHQCVGSTSEELFKYVGKDQSRGIFQGRINVHPDAQQTDAQMMANALLLSDGAEFLSKPELEIFADDVQCAHGCTAGELDEDQMFYLMSRGIPRPEAEKLLILSFVAGVFDALTDDDVVAWLQGQVINWLDRQGDHV